MDQNSILDYVETTTESLKETEEFIHSIKKLNVNYIIIKYQNMFF